MRLLCLCLCFLFNAHLSYSQTEVEAVPDALMVRLSSIGDSVLNGSSFEVRKAYNMKLLAGLEFLITEDPLFTKDLSQIPTISCLVSADRKLRLITWQFQNEEFFHFNYGLVQYRSKKEGLLKYTLVDTSLGVAKPNDTILSDSNWYGAIYYNMVSRKGKKGRMYYTLFGWDGFHALANRKVIEVLYFDKKGNIWFGDKIFHKDIAGSPNRLYHRHFLEYANDAVVTLNYSTQFEKIMMDHLIPKDGGHAKLTFTLVPDGSYQGFEWKKKKWEFIDKVFHQKFSEPPVPKPVDFKKDHD